MQLPRQNETFAGEYVIEGELGEGGFAVVYRAVRAGQVVALKVLKPQNGSYSFELVARFNREARALAELHHPNIPEIFDHGRSPDGLLYIASELIPGDELRTLVERGPVSEELSEHVIREVLKALAAAHGSHLLHRDIKPDNIRLAPTHRGLPPRVVLLDFGLARDTQQEKGGRLTETGVLVGTPRYMSPEQLMSAPLTPASEIYSLAMVGAEMLLGSAALHGASLTDQVDRVSGQTSIVVPDTRGPLAPLLRRGLAWRAEDRPQSAADALRLLDGVERAPTEAAEAGRPAATWTTVALVFVMLSVLGVWLLWPASEEPAPAFTRENPLAEVSPVSPEVEEVPLAAQDIDAGQDMSVDAGFVPPPQRPLGKHCRDREPLESGSTEVWGPKSREGKHRVRYILPRSYDSTRKYPVVFLYHDGAPATQERVLRTSGFGDLVDPKDFILVAPGDAKLLGTPWTASSMMIVRNAFQAIDELLCIDRDRVYTVGNGRGGRAAWYTACQIGEIGGRVRAVATNGWRSDAFQKPPECDIVAPYMHAFGTLDPDMPPTGGKRCSGDRDFTPVARHDQFWRDRLGCRGKGDAWSVDDRCRTWRCDHTYVTCHFEGDGRSWWAGPCAAGGPETAGLAEKMWRFFESVD